MDTVADQCVICQTKSLPYVQQSQFSATVYCLGSSDNLVSTKISTNCRV